MNRLDISKTNEVEVKKNNEIEAFNKKEEQEAFKEELIRQEILNGIKKEAVREAVEKMTLSEMVGQCIIDFSYGGESHSNNGNRILMGESFQNEIYEESVEQVMAQEKNIYPFIAIDQEGGKVGRITKSEKFNDIELPSIKELGKMEDSEVEEAGRRYGELLNQIGVNTLLISLDVAKAETLMDKEQRSFGDSAERVEHKAEVYLRGVRSAAPKMSVFGQHFPSYNVKKSSDYYGVVDESSKEEIISRTAPFSLSSLNGVMISSVVYPELSPKPALFDKKIIDWARTENPDLMVMTDDLYAFVRHEEKKQGKEIDKKQKKQVIENAVEGTFNAGVDIIMILSPKYAKIANQHIMFLLKEDKKHYQGLAERLDRIVGEKINVNPKKRDITQDKPLDSKAAQQNLEIEKRTD